MPSHRSLDGGALALVATDLGHIGTRTTLDATERLRRIELRESAFAIPATANRSAPSQAGFRLWG